MCDHEGNEEEEGGGRGHWSVVVVISASCVFLRVFSLGILRGGKTDRRKSWNLNLDLNVDQGLDWADYAKGSSRHRKNGRGKKRWECVGNV